MKIAYASDLHIEINGWDKTQSQTKDVESGDILVLAGDTVAAPYLLPHRTDPRARSIREATERCMTYFSGLYQKIIMIGGNHEHYGMSYNNTYSVMKGFMEQWPNVSYLENEVVDYKGVKFVCATLWTNMKNSDPLVIETCRRGMNDYHLIYTDDKDTRRSINPHFTVEKHYESLNFIRNETTQQIPTIVVTHHLPSNIGIRPYYRSQGNNLLNYAYFSDIDIPETVGAWIHGHTHYTHVEKLDKTWLVANQLGYYMEGHSFYDFRVNRWLTVRDDGKIVPEQRGGQ